MRFCACMREISKQSQVSTKARHTRHLLLLKKSCCEELLLFYARQNARHCSRACAATTSCLGTLALQPPLCRCISTPGKIGHCSQCALPPYHARGHWHCSRCCAAASRHQEKCLVLQPCVRCCHVMPGDIGAAATAAPLHLDSWQNPGAAAMCAPLPRHAQGHWAAES